jgi:hypothetical protein
MSSAARVQRVACSDGERTWTVLDGDQRVVGPAEQYLECLRMLGRSPNTVKSYARALALWWQFLVAYDVVWDAVTIEDFGRFLGWLRSGDSPAVASIQRRPARFSEQTICGAVAGGLLVLSLPALQTASRPRRGCMSVLSRGRAYRHHRAWHHRAELKRLEDALAAAQGENLELRRAGRLAPSAPR